MVNNLVPRHPAPEHLSAEISGTNVGHLWSSTIDGKVSIQAEAHVYNPRCLGYRALLVYYRNLQQPRVIWAATQFILQPCQPFHLINIRFHTLPGDQLYVTLAQDSRNEDPQERNDVNPVVFRMHGVLTMV